MKFVHYTDNSNFILKPIIIKNTTWVKPEGGLWCSPIDSIHSWKDFCISEEFGDIDSDYKVVLDIDMKQSLIINTYKDILKLSWIEKRSIDFVSMIQQGIDCVFLTANGERQTKYTTLYGWDCESIVILNDKCIKNYKLLKE